MPELSVPQVAQELGVIVTKVHQWIRERQLLAVRRDGILRVPAGFVQDGEIVKGVTATITLLTDAGYSDLEIIDWMHREDDSLPGTPVQALRENRGREVKRRAQVAGF
ncbi:DNA-binding protein [Nakamurella flavida]|uniref:DNA-binding protein n=1 Tax=Nakamurella flavida TaxID=363630 RepID=A0A938YMI1_9ACTN|nr:DNA-binding protein [Nakamurella flavida]